MSAGLLAFLIAASASLLLTVPVRALAIRVGMVDLPGPRKVHLKPIPLLGGLAIYGGVMLAILIVFDGPARAQVIGIASGATLVAVVGFLDDRGWLHHQIKLFVAMPLAAVILLLSGIHAQVFSLVLRGSLGYWMDAAFTIVWVVGITASFSILDHMDGLCAGVAAMASVFFTMIAYLNGQTLVATLAASVLGAAAGSEEIVLSDPELGVYKKLVIAGDRLIGAVLFGDTSDALWYLDLIRSASSIERLRGDLVFGGGPSSRAAA